MSAKFIVFEGIDGSGKTTQSKMLHKHFQDLEVPSILTISPGGTPFSDEIRSLLLSGKTKDIGAAVELYLFTAVRCDLIRNVITPALHDGKVVIADRFYFSAAYQWATYGKELAALGLPSGEVVTKMREFGNRLRDSIKTSLLLSTVSGYVHPDLVIYLDVPAELGWNRRKRRSSTETDDRFEREGIEYQRDLKTHYENMMEMSFTINPKYDHHVATLPGNMTEQDLHKHVLRYVGVYR